MRCCLHAALLLLRHQLEADWPVSSARYQPDSKRFPWTIPLNPHDPHADKAQSCWTGLWQAWLTEESLPPLGLGRHTEQITVLTTTKATAENITGGSTWTKHQESTQLTLNCLLKVSRWDSKNGQYKKMQTDTTEMTAQLDSRFSRSSRLKTHSFPPT